MLAIRQVHHIAIIGSDYQASKNSIVRFWVLVS